MPGSVENASPTGVMPWSLCKAFGHSREYPILENEYRDGSSQRSRLANTSRKRWSTQRRLAPDLLDEFRQHYEDCRGGLDAFWFYDPYDTNPKFSYDPTGIATTGRYLVRYDCEWSQEAGIARSDVRLDVIELA